MAKFNFKQSATNQTVLSHLMNGREQKKTEEIIAEYPDGVTIVEFDFARIVNTKTGELNEFPVIIIQEDDTIFFNGGTILGNICKEWVIQFDGDMDECNKELAKSGGLKIKMSAGKTKNGNNITKIDIL